MKSKLPISVTIIAKNEADRIIHTLESIKDISDDIIVVDSGSTDNTKEVVEKFGARFIYNEWRGYGPQKIFCEKVAKYDWILNLDADEAITEKLEEEIRALFANGTPDEKTAFSLKILAIFCYQTKLPMFPTGTVQTRIYNKKFSGFRDSTVHDAVVLGEGVKLIPLNGIVLHRSFRNHTHAVEKINFYSSAQAMDMFKKGRNPSAMRIIFEPVFAFLKSYILRRYIFQGIDGFIHSCIYSFSRTIRIAKARELFQMEKMKDKQSNF